MASASSAWYDIESRKGYNTKLDFYIGIEYTQNVSANTTTISNITLYMRCTDNTNPNFYWHWTLTPTGSTSGAAASSDSAVKVSAYSTAKIFSSSGSRTVQHDSEGNGTFQLKCSMSSAYTDGTWAYRVQNTTVSIVLPKIARATTPTLSASSINAGGSLTVTMNRASSSFTHNVYIKFGSTTVASATGQGTSYTWSSVLATECARMPNTTSGTYTVECQTYNGSTLIGTKSVTFTVNVPSSVVPTISNSTTVGQDSSTIQSAIGALVQGKSKLKVVISASGIYGSSIASYKTTFNGATYTGQSFTTDYVNTSGNNLPVVITVTDSRGRTSTALTRNVTVLPYSAPKISGLTVFRVNTSGTEDDEGTRIGITWEYKVSSLNGHNTLTHIHEYRADNSSTYSALASQAVLTVSSGTDPNVKSGTTKYTTSPTITTEGSYVIRVRIWDYFGSSSNYISREMRLSTAFTLMDFNASGKGMAIGKVSEDANGLELNLPTYLYTALHFRTLSGTNDAVAIGRDSSDGGSLFLYNSQGQAIVQIYPASSNGRINIKNSAGKTVVVFNTISHNSGSSYNGRFALNDYNGDERVCAYAYPYGRLALKGSSGTNDTILLSGNTGNVSCTSVSQSSSRKIKKNIEPISEEEALKLLELEPVSFDFKDEDMGSDQRGFIAEDVKEILPNIVIDEEDGRPMGINYTQLIPYLTKMVQTQQERINELEQRIAALESE